MLDLCWPCWQRGLNELLSEALLPPPGKGPLALLGRVSHERANAGSRIAAWTPPQMPQGHMTFSTHTYVCFDVEAEVEAITDGGLRTQLQLHGIYPCGSEMVER